MRNIKFITSEICLYHIYNRGVEKREIFLDDSDYLRFIHNLYEFNGNDAARKFSVCENITKINSNKQGNLSVEILCYCLMPNHYHILLRQKRDGGIVQFMHKLGTGYTMYFNERYQRSGVLFQGKFKAVMIDNEAYFKHIPYYIHSNPLEIIEPDWKIDGINDMKKCLQFLENYRWSSYADYIGKKNFPSVISKEFFTTILGNNYQYRQQIEEWLKREIILDNNGVTIDRSF